MIWDFGMEELLSENKLLNTRRGLLKGTALGALALLGLSNRTLSAQERYTNAADIMPDDKLCPCQKSANVKRWPDLSEYRYIGTSTETCL